MSSQVVFEKINVPCNVSLETGPGVGLTLAAPSCSFLELLLHVPNMFTCLETLRNVFACDVKSETDGCFKNDYLLNFL